MPMLSLVIPTYNERENIKALIGHLESLLKENAINAEIIVVDDNSPDGTGKICKAIAKRQKNIVVIQRPGKLGLSSAVIDGFTKAKGDVLGVMDADFSHPVSAIPRMFEAISDGADMAVGSRYIRGGKTVGWPMTRKVTSFGAKLIALPLTRIHDPVSGLFMFRRSVIDGVKLNPIGYKIGLEVIVKGNYRKLVEVPITFINRKAGKTKLDIKEYNNYLKHISQLLLYKLQR